MTPPRIIALCGHPGAGKSEVQRILHERHGYEPADDGWPLRDFAIRQFGLSLDDVMTQAGKNRTTTITGAVLQNRDILGRIGNALEQQFGGHILPWLACRGLDPSRHYSFGSVRRDQAKTYKMLGGLIVGVRKPGAGPSQFEFDSFDESLVDVWIDNDGSLDHLEQKVTWALQAAALKAVA